MKFLYNIAKIYAEKLTSTAQLLFVFPNRRAGLFLKKELLSLTKKTIFAPDIIDINSFATTLSPLNKTNEIELLFLLYDSYVHIRSQHTDDIESIDTFIPFGSTLLKDFNEIDKYLIDAKTLFSNISNIKNINDQSQFLTEKQIEALNSFWKKIKDKNEKNEVLSFNQQFISLWDDLYDIYIHFTENLIKKGIGYDGLIYRTAINNLEKIQNIKYNTICFIGFNSLTTSEYHIFKFFQHKGIADFYFDYPTCYTSSFPFSNSVAKYYERNLKEFPSQHEYLQPTEIRIPNITLHSTPSNTNQINIICSLLKNNEEYEKYAILLSDESLMTSLIQKLPSNVKKINITMGYPLSITPMATLINHILSLQTELTNNKEGEPLFYHKPILSLLSHSNIQKISFNATTLLIEQINQGNYIRISENQIHSIIKTLDITNEEKEFFINIFTIHTSTIDLLNYLQQIIHSLLSFNTSNAIPTDQEFLYQYQQVLNQLTATLKHFNYSEITPQLLKILINRLTASLKVQFKGEPVEGMQIMGMLESRLLDFDNIILLGFNDSKIPGNQSINSIIPYNLRKAHNLPTYEESDAIQAYNFYRTFYHTKNLHLIYDSRNEGTQNEISRYFYQIKYLLNAPIKQNNYTLPFLDEKENDCINSSSIVITKTNDIIQKLNTYKTNNNLSASRLKDYITCPLRFYFSTIASIKKPNEIKETGESSLLGLIYHKTMELYYIKYKLPQKIDKQSIKNLVKEAFIEETKTSGKQVETNGFNSLIFNLVVQFIDNTIKFDINRYKKEKFTNVQSEVEIIHTIKNINFKGYIDRIDKTNNTINIIDYKTTVTAKNDKGIPNIIDLFNSYKSIHHEIFQIILYCYIYRQKFGDKYILKPSLYKTYELNKPNATLQPISLKIPNILRDKNNLPNIDIPIQEINTDTKNCTTIEVTDYTLISTPFEWLLEKMLNNIYDPNTLFCSNENATETKACKFCSYKTICKKNNNKN